MPDPIPVELHPHDPAWAESARREGERVAAALGKIVIVVHHIGSTSIPGIKAKPILDLMPLVTSLRELDLARPIVEGLGYQWWGEFGIEGRRYCTLGDPQTGRRKIQLHFFEAASPKVGKHLAFRDYLRSRPDLAREYEAEKARCRELHPLNSHDYTDCKGAWIRRIEAEALAAIGHLIRKT